MQFTRRGAAAESGWRDTVKFNTPRDQLIEVANLLATLSPSPENAFLFVCPVLGCGRQDERARLATHLLAEHIDACKASSAVQARFVSASLESGTCPIHTCRGAKAGSWLAHMEEAHLYEMWLLAVRLMTVYSTPKLSAASLARNRFSNNSIVCPHSTCHELLLEHQLQPHILASHFSDLLSWLVEDPHAPDPVNWAQVPTDTAFHENYKKKQVLVPPLLSPGPPKFLTAAGNQDAWTPRSLEGSIDQGPPMGFVGKVQTTPKPNPLVPTLAGTRALPGPAIPVSDGMETTSMAAPGGISPAAKSAARAAATAPTVHSETGALTWPTSVAALLAEVSQVSKDVEGMHVLFEQLARRLGQLVSWRDMERFAVEWGNHLTALQQALRQRDQGYGAAALSIQAQLSAQVQAQVNAIAQALAVAQAQWQSQE
eukprot:gene26451-17550_t